MIDLCLNYLAGYLDGEGCFMFTGGTPRVCVSNTYPHTLRAMQKRFGGTISVKSAKAGSRRCFEWRVSGAEASNLCRSVSPLLIEKQAQAQLLLQIPLYPVRSSMRRSLTAELTRLKRINYE